MKDNLRAIHHGHYPLPDRCTDRVAAHDETNLLHRGHEHCFQIAEREIGAHGELQEGTVLVEEVA